MQFEIKSRISGAVMFACELSAEVAGQTYGLQLGFAVKKAVEACADLRCANLQCADLRCADLQCANLQCADLRRASLRSANLQHTDLQHTNLQYANLQSANLQYAHLQSANLQYANLRSANLQYTHLQSANLQYANLQHTHCGDLAIAQTRILADGDLIGWKKCNNGVIVKLQIPADAKRSHAFGRKCRAEFVRVLEVIGAEPGISTQDDKTEYRAGATVTPDAFCDDWQQECAQGIHFFITRAEAEAY